MEAEDSFEILKMNLCQDFVEEACSWKLEKEAISPPNKPLNAFIVFNLEQSKKDAENLGSSWNDLDKSEKRRLKKDYESRLHKYNILMEQYKSLTMKKNILNPYLRFYRKIYGILEAQRNHSTTEITKIIKEAWNKLDEEEKRNYERQYEEELFQRLSPQEDRDAKLERYQKKLEEYENTEKQLRPEKAKRKPKQKIRGSETKKVQNRKKKHEEITFMMKREQENIEKLQKLKQKELLQLRNEKISLLHSLSTVPASCLQEK